MHFTQHMITAARTNPTCPSSCRCSGSVRGIPAVPGPLPSGHVVVNRLFYTGSSEIDAGRRAAKPDEWKMIWFGHPVSSLKREPPGITENIQNTLNLYLGLSSTGREAADAPERSSCRCFGLENRRRRPLGSLTTSRGAPVESKRRRGRITVSNPPPLNTIPSSSIATIPS